MDSDGWRRNKRNILDASGRSNRRRLTPGKRMERRPGRRHEDAVAEQSLLNGRNRPDRQDRHGELRTDSNTTSSQTISLTRRTPDSPDAIPSGTILQIWGDQQSLEARSTLPIQRMRLPTPTTALADIWHSDSGRGPDYYAGIGPPGTQTRSIDVPHSSGAVRGRSKRDQRTRWDCRADTADHLTEIPGRPRRKRLDAGIKNDIKTRDGRIGLRRFWAPVARSATAN